MPNLDIPTKDLGGKRLSYDVLKYVPRDSASYYEFLPVGVTDGVLEIGMVNPDNIEARDAIQFISTKVAMPFKIFVISKNDFTEGLKSYEGLSSEVDQALNQFGAEESTSPTGPELIKDGEDRGEGKANIIEEAPVTKIVGVILQHASSGNASDIHIEPTADKIKVRFRVDGTLFTSLFLPLQVHDAVVARIKILTNMKLDEKRKPQDGRFSAKVEGRKIDFRVSTFPTYFGEKVVMRILDPDKKLVDLESIGLTGRNLEMVKSAIERPHGLILLTGPTGSGKTTTLYSMLQAVDKEKANAVSLEDPIEYDIPGVNQSQVRPEINYTFANGLRSILRQDPDIIMVGEIRDRQTARLAIQASLTGHLVFSTIHTNSAMGVIPRLIDMGVEPYLIPPTLILTIGQRLVPTLCEEKSELPVEDSIKVMFEKQFEDLPEQYRKEIVIPEKVYGAKKSATCPSGTRGRIAAFEMIEMDRELEKLILSSPSEGDLYKYARSKGFTTMKEDAMIKAFKGIVPFEEVNKL
jgi:type IV pilus assembly protein PilB